MVGLLGCPRKLGSMVRINGLFHLLINDVYWSYNPFPGTSKYGWSTYAPSRNKGLMRPYLGKPMVYG